MSTALVVLTILNGCTSRYEKNAFEPWLENDPSQWQTTENGSVHHLDTLQNQPSTRDAEMPSSHATPVAADAGADAYVLIALAQNPSIRAAEHRVERMGARGPQVTSLDDPMLQVAPFGEMAETAAGQVGLMTGVSQKLPFPGKLDTRGRIAEQDVAAALADLQQTRLQVVGETRRAFWSYYFATRAIETTRQSRELLSQFHQIAESQYATGTRSQTDVLRASVELSNLDTELITLTQRQATARSMLNQLLDRPVNAPLPEPAPLKPDHVTEQLDTLLAAAATHNPSIQKVHERIEQFRQQKKLANLNRWPDLTVSASYNVVDDAGLAGSANGDDQWWFGFGINLPIWTEKYDAQEREALRGLLEGTADLTAQRNRVAFQVHDAYLKVEAQQDLIELFNEVIIPQAKQTVDASASGYRAGSVDFLTLVDNWRKLLNFDLMYHRAIADMEQAVADLERAVGQDVARDSQSRVPIEESSITPLDASQIEGKELTP